MQNKNIQKFVDKVNNSESAMSAKEFIDGLSKMKTDDGINAYMNKHIKIYPYLPYQIKMTVAKVLVKASTFDDKGHFHVDSCRKRILFVDAVLRYYTNIHLNSDEIFGEYDLVQKNGIYDYVKSQIPERELMEFSAVVDMVYSDIITNEYEPRNYIDKQLSKLKEFSNPIAQMIQKTLDKINVEDVQNKLAQLR